MSKFKNESPSSSPKRSLSNRITNLGDSLVKVKQIDPISVNKARIKSKRNSNSFLNKLIR
jgi:hypothetical protein